MIATPSRQHLVGSRKRFDELRWRRVWKESGNMFWNSELSFYIYVNIILIGIPRY